MNVVYEDNHIIIVNKKSGEIVQGDKTGDKPLSDIGNLGPNCPLGLARAVLAAAIIGVEVRDEEDTEDAPPGEATAPD